MPIRAGSTPVMLKSGQRSGMKVGGQGAAAVAAFDPTALSGLVAWYDFSDATTLFTDTGRTTPVASNGDSIAGVTDKSGSGNHLTQATAGARPPYTTNALNGRSAAGNDGSRFLSSGNVNYAQPNTVFIVAKHGDGVAAKHFFDSNAGAGRQIVGTNTGPVWMIYAGTILTGGATNTNNNIFVARFNGGSSFLYVNGGAANASGAVGAQPLGNGTGGVFVGQGQGAQLPAGSVLYEIVVCNAATSLASINSFGAYTQTKWGLTWTTAV